MKPATGTSDFGLFRVIEMLFLQLNARG
jgi:hypothetical protein